MPKHSHFTRLALVALSLAATAALTACGYSSVESALEPDRFLSVGDGYSDIGQGPNGARPSINDGSLLWTEQLASMYGKTITPANAGGLSWAQAYARVTQPDASGHNAPSITTQVDRLLTHTRLNANDVVLVSGGLPDIYAEVTAAGGIVTDATRANVRQAGTELGKQVRRLVDSGAKYVAVTGTYNVGKTPWALSLGDATAGAIAGLSSSFNDALLIEINDLWQSVLFRDSALIYNLVANEPDDFGIEDQTLAVCTVPSAYDCNRSTLLPGANPDNYMWADSLHLTPRMSNIFGDNGYTESMGSQLEDRW